MKPTVIDLFAGVGGMSLGFEMSGFDVLLANEYDKSIAEAYNAARTDNINPSKIIVCQDNKLTAQLTIAANKNIIYGRIYTSDLN